ncbi:arsenite methyltransferase [Wolbachia endosymbiont of Ctenocephalides felis wCfeT]|uniref:arsenite methyltransferase n=1 Tax=Wolbachia endosymbiont of Ctenocephalides felis wCfeT TaxID=2732593 RepID=UPI0014489508|nr:arsenite methyltransferase [Wolbachia endosymbiont of Ctenocephalides felis wCfeT]
MLTNAEEDIKIKEAVRETYGKVAETNTAGKDCGNTMSCCGAPSETDIEYSRELGYSEEEAKSVPTGANMGLGCGNPVAIASLKSGEVVLDLGSGGGFDCFLAAKRVGSTGRVIGVDMTPSMISKSRLNAEKGGYSHVEFRLGEIEALPVADASVDVVISNCVINLSTNKPQVFKEIARVLKPGGRLSVSDIVATNPLPEAIKKDLALYAGCIAGAMSVGELKQALVDAGLKDINIQVKEASRTFIEKWTSESGAENYVASAVIEARSPAIDLAQQPSSALSSTDVTKHCGGLCK